MRDAHAPREPQAERMASAAGTISAALDPEAARLAAETRVRAVRKAGGRELWSGVAVAAAFLAAASALAALGPPREASPALYVLLIAAYAVATRVKFELSAGVYIPTQLILVPMFFLLPVGAVPLCVAAGWMLSFLVDEQRGRVHMSRGYVALANAWHAVGPAVVLSLAFDGDAAPAWTHWPYYVAALAAQLALDFGCSAVRPWLVLGINPLAQLRATLAAYLVDVALAPVGLLVAFAAYGQPLAFALVLPLLWVLASFAGERTARIDNALELSDAYRGTAFLLGDVVEADDTYTGEHSRDVVELVLGVADRMGLTARERQQAEFVALLHDVGKIRIPNEIINKPGALTPDERALIETHTVVGEQMLERVGGLLGEVGRLVRSCHERWDGTGYPDGLVGEQIPLVSRIVCCCDAYNAMTTHRPYRRARSVEEAVAELHRCAGSQFDPAVVEAVVELAGA